MKVLYITNIEVPYRTTFFNQLAQRVELTVLYERRVAQHRDAGWTASVERNYVCEYLDGVDSGNESGFSLSIIGWVKRGWDRIIIGCYNTKSQLLAMAYMRLRRIPFSINLDGDPFIGTGLKSAVKRWVLRGAASYFVAGDMAALSVAKVVGNKPISVYHFSSLTRDEVERNASLTCEREDFVLVVGQYLDAKGLDVAVEVARSMPHVPFRFVGTGVRSTQFVRDCAPIPANVELIAFLPKDALMEQYRKCRALVLPSRQECWGLVVNEAASLGTPIVSTTGSGAAVEFLADSPFAHYLARPGDADSLQQCLARCLATPQADYSLYLKEKSRYYTIEENVEKHI